MPTPKPSDETHSEWMHRCVPKVLDDGTAEDNKQAVAICMNMWRRAGKSEYVEQKAWVETLTGISLITGLAIGGAAALYLYELALNGAARLSSAAFASVQEYFRGAEAVLQDKIAAKELEIDALANRLVELRDQLGGLYDKLGEVRQASSDAASDYDGRFDEPQKSIGAHGVYR